MALASYSSWLAPGLLSLFGLIFVMRYVVTARWGDSYRAYNASAMAGMGVFFLFFVFFGVIGIVERDWFIVVMATLGAPIAVYAIALSRLALRGRDTWRWEFRVPRWLKRAFLPAYALDAFEDGQRRVTSSRRVSEEGLPVLLVSHDADGDWQFLSGKEEQPDERIVLQLADVLEPDPSLRAVENLAEGWKAWRSEVGSRWTRDLLPDDQATI